MMDYNRYERQIMLPEIGEKGQQLIMKSSVLIVGLGGLGSPVALYLTGAGIGRIGLCDYDKVSLSNLQRQVLYDEASIGELKTEAARRRLSALSSETMFELYSDGLNTENARAIVSGYDLVVDCCDKFSTRYLIDDVCAECSKSWIYASIGTFNGQVAVMNGKAGVRYSDVYPDREQLCARPHVTAGVVGALPGVIGALEAAEALKVLGGFGEPLDGKMLSLDLLSMEMMTFVVKN